MTHTTVPPIAGKRSRPVDFLFRHRATGIAVVGTAVSIALVAPLPAVVETYVTAWGVLLAAVIYLSWGSARRDLGGGMLRAQTFGVLAFGAVALLAVAVTPAVAHYVLAAGWLLHAVWDLVHHRLDRVVPRWYAEACLVSDLIIGTALLLTAPF